MLGAGSFATVWLAVDEVLDAKVAIKVLADNWSRQPDIRRRFIDEAKILRRLDDDRVVRVHQVDEMADGRPFFVMTWADRATLFDRIQEKARAQQPFSVTEAVELTIEIARCLEVVHGFGVVHRDIKPSNVLFRSMAGRVRAAARRDPTAGIAPESTERMMLGDFGLAKDLAGASGFTFAAGTPAYMAPEQARSSTDIDERADVFSATAVLYELLTGRPAFSAETLSGVARSHSGRDLEPLTTARPDAPAALWRVLRQGLAPAREDRIGSAEELVEALQAVPLAGRVSPFAPPPAPPATVTSLPPRPAGPPPPPLPLMVAQTVQLLDQLAATARSAPADSHPPAAVAGAADVLGRARRRLLDPVQVLVVGPNDGTTSELAWSLAGERLAGGSFGGGGQLFCRLQAAPASDRRNGAVGLRRSGERVELVVHPDSSGSLVIAAPQGFAGRPGFTAPPVIAEPSGLGAPPGVLGSGSPQDITALTVLLTSPALTHRTVIDAGPLLAQPVGHGQGGGVPAPAQGSGGAAGQGGAGWGVPASEAGAAVIPPGRALAEADLLAVILPASVESGRALLAGLKELLRASPGGPVLAMGVVSPGPGSTVGGPGSVPAASAELVSAYGADPTVSAQLSGVSALRNGRAPMLDAAFEALLRHSDAVRVTAALAQAEDGLSRRADPASRAAFHGLRDGREALVATFPALEELAVLREEASGRLTLPASYRNELRRLLAGGDPAARLGLAPGAGGAELRHAAEVALERWRTFVNTGRAPFASIHASQTVVRALERLWAGSQQRPF